MVIYIALGSVGGVFSLVFTGVESSSLKSMTCMNSMCILFLVMY